MDVIKENSKISHVRLRVTFVKRTRRGGGRETYKIKDSDAQVNT